MRMPDSIENMDQSTAPAQIEIDELGKLLAQKKLIPFIGAGISRQHLGFAGAELAKELAELLDEPSTSLLSDLANTYTERHGEDGFAEYLTNKLTLDDIDESKISTHLLLLSLLPNLIYTTNQDNIFELAAKKYGRPYKRIVTLNDLSNSTPGEPLLIKFHGDPCEPASLIFSSQSYERRVETRDHPLDIKLRADLLGKQLLFVGYSLMDENVNKLLATVKRVFGDSMPPSYLLAYEYDDSMEKFKESYGVTVLDPRRYHNSDSPSEAFQRVLKLLCDSVLKFHVNQGLTDMFENKELRRSVVIEYEVDALEKLVESSSFDAGIDAFRGLIDQALVPAPLQLRVTRTFEILANAADGANAKQMNDLKGALFNFRLSPENALTAVATVMKACNRRPLMRGFDEFSSLICPALPDGSLPGAAAMAVLMLRDSGEPISDSFRNVARVWFGGYQKISSALQDDIKAVIQLVWPIGHEHGSPLNQNQHLFSGAKGFHEILNDMKNQMPKQLKNPEK